MDVQEIIIEPAGHITGLRRVTLAYATPFLPRAGPGLEARARATLFLAMAYYGLGRIVLWAPIILRRQKVLSIAWFSERIFIPSKRE